MNLNLKEILSEAADFYKGNLKSLMGFSFILVIFMAIFSIFLSILGLFSIDDPWDNIVLWGFAIFGLIILLVTWLALVIIFAPRFYLGIMVYINALMNGEQITFRQAYQQTKGKYWALFGRLLLISFLAVLVTFFSTLFFPAEHNPFVNTFFTTLLLAAIFSLFYMIFPVIALEPVTRDALKRSVRMIQGNYGNILLLYLLTSSLLSFFYQLNLHSLEGNAMGLVILGVLYHIALFFVFPFAETVIVVVYRKLIERKENQP